jgi:hypothetical protein
MENVLAYLHDTSDKHELHPHHQTQVLYQQTTPISISTNALEEIEPNIQQFQEVYQKSGVMHTIPTPNNIITKGIARMLNNQNTHFSKLSTVRVHINGGANWSITNNKDNLLSYRNIKKYPMSGVAAAEVALTCSGVGYLPWQADTGELVLVKCYYSSDAADTILSPTDIVANNIHNYEAWEQYSHVDTG